MDKTSRQVVVTFKDKATLNIGFANGNGGAQGIDVSLQDLQDSGPDAAEARIGAAVLALLEEITGMKLGLRDYKKFTAEAMARVHDLLANQAKEGDPAAQNAMGLKCMEDALAQKSLDQLEVAERWFEKAAALGYRPAKDFLAKGWPKLKANYRKRIEGS